MRNRFGWMLAIGLALPACALAQARGDFFDAGRVAFDDYAAELKREQAASPDPTQGLARYVFDLRHYAVGMAYSSKGIEVEIRLRQPTDPDLSILGGGGHYLVDQNTLKILEKHLYE